MKIFSGLSLSRQFLITSFPILLFGMLVIGTWVGREVQSSVVNRLGSVTGLYVESFLAPYVQTLVNADDLSEKDKAGLDRLLTNTRLGKRIVAFKIWRRDGRVLYSKDTSMMGRSFPIGEGLVTGFAGGVHSKISDLSHAENELEARRWDRLIETYVPIHAEGLGRIVAVAEFYQTTDELDKESWAAQRQSWLVVAATVLMMYLLLFGLVHRGSKTIDRQRQELKHKVAELTALIEQNETLHDKVRRAAARTTALNEQFLRRISADLHDGPGQDLGLALMKFEALADVWSACPGRSETHESGAGEVQGIRSVLQSALTDLRAISAGLQLPAIDQLSIDEIAARAVRDYERKTFARVKLTLPPARMEASLSVKITLYRLLQEALINGFRHAGGAGQQVDVTESDDYLMVEVSDNGCGFDPPTAATAGRQGLAGMRERVEILGGSFELNSAPKQGTTIRVILPLVVPGVEHE
jgi:signal transduction histidine kinase